MTKAVRKNLLKALDSELWLFIISFVLGQSFRFKIGTSLAFLIIFLFPLTFFIICYFLAPYIKRAFIYQLIQSTLGVISSILVFLSMYSYLVFSTADSIPYLTLIMHLILLILTSIISTKKEQVNLLSATALNIDSGLLNLTKGTWNISKTIQWDNPKSEAVRKNIYKGVSRISIIIPGLGMLVAIWLHPSSTEISKLFLLFFAYIFAFGSGRNLNLVFQLRKWENEINKPIHITITE